jgi:hypothetical protein
MSEDKFAAAKEAVNKLKHESVKTVFTDHLTFVYDNPGEDDVALNVQLKRVSRYCSNLSSSGTELDLMLQQIYNSQEVTQNSKALKVASNSSDVEGMSVGAPAVGDRRDRNDLAEDAASQAPPPCTNESQYCKEVAASLNARHSEIQVFINEAQPNRLQALLKRMFTANTGWASIWPSPLEVAKILRAREQATVTSSLTTAAAFSFPATRAREQSVHSTAAAMQLLKGIAAHLCACYSSILQQERWRRTE